MCFFWPPTEFFEFFCKVAIDNKKQHSLWFPFGLNSFLSCFSPLVHSLPPLHHPQSTTTHSRLLKIIRQRPQVHVLIPLGEKLGKKYHKYSLISSRNLLSIYPRHHLQDVEKKSYIDAVLCLMAKPSTMKYPGSQTRWDDLTYVHRVNTNIVHNVGGLLPWHRYYTYMHETMLREECGYQGYQPYWETVLDVGNILGSTILDPVTGFGGNGTGSDLCVSDGPFANVTLHLGPKYTNTDHCLSRNVNELVATQNCSQTNIDALFKLTTFETVWELFGNSIQ